MTDLEKFIDLYKSFGIELTIQNGEDGYKNNPGGSVIVLDETVDKRLGCGEEGSNSTVRFDKDGKFIDQEFWE